MVTIPVKLFTGPHKRWCEGTWHSAWCFVENMSHSKLCLEVAAFVFHLAPQTEVERCCLWPCDALRITLSLLEEKPWASACIFCIVMVFYLPFLPVTLNVFTVCLFFLPQSLGCLLSFLCSFVSSLGRLSTSPMSQAGRHWGQMLPHHCGR